MYGRYHTLTVGTKVQSLRAVGGNGWWCADTTTRVGGSGEVGKTRFLASSGEGRSAVGVRNPDELLVGSGKFGVQGFRSD